MATVTAQMILECFRPKTDQDRLLEECIAQLTAIHARKIRGRSIRCTIVFRSDVTEEQLVLAHTGSRVEAWRVDMVVCEAVCTESFLLRVR
jgi:hypothetical protein